MNRNHTTPQPRRSRRDGDEKTPMRRRAFTLVELLVVLAIITTLIAILLPSLRGARRAARTAVCASNLRQLQVAMLLYGSDNRNKTFPYDGNIVYIIYLMPYQSGIDALRLCPEATRISTTPSSWSKSVFPGSATEA